MRVGMVGSKGIPVSYGGVETHVRELATRLAKRGHDVTVFCRTHCTPRVNEYQGVRLVRLPALRTKTLEMATHTLLSVIAAWFRSFDLVHFQSVEPTLFAPLVKWHAPVISTSHGQSYRRAKWGPCAKWAARRAETVFMRVPDARIAVSQTLKRYYEGRYGRRVIYIPNGVNVYPPIREHAALDAHGLIPNGYVLFAGRLDPSKGCHVAIEAYLRSRIAKRLVVIGSSTYTHRYVEKIYEYGSDRILFLEYQTGAEFWQFMQNCCAFVFPSEIEGLSIVLLEALGQGRPVIYSDIPENAEVAEGIGYPFRTGDVEDLAAKIRYVAEHPEEARIRGEQGKPRILQEFNWDRVVDRTEQAYRHLLAMHRGHGELDAHS
jgi:glycosyltransferase involved in cell wall biosynthesis